MLGPERLLPQQPPYAEVILAEDDPFNTPEDVAALKAVASKYRVTLLPRGGHLGFVNDPWTKAKLLELFNTPAPAAAPPKLSARIIELKK